MLALVALYKFFYLLYILITLKEEYILMKQRKEERLEGWGGADGRTSSNIRGGAHSSAAPTPGNAHLVQEQSICNNRPSACKGGASNEWKNERLCAWLMEVQVEEVIDGWMGGWVGGQMGGWMGRWMDGWMMDKRMEGWMMDERIDGRINGLMNGWEQLSLRDSICDLFGVVGMFESHQIQGKYRA